MKKFQFDKNVHYKTRCAPPPLGKILDPPLTYTVWWWGYVGRLVCRPYIGITSVRANRVRTANEPDGDFLSTRRMVVIVVRGHIT